MRPPARPFLFALPLALAAACTPSATTLDDSARQDVAAAVIAVTDSLTEAMNAHDADRILAFFDASPDFVYVSCTNVVAGGEIFAGLTRSLHSARKGVVFEIQVLGTRVLGANAAFVTLHTESSDTLTSSPILTTRILSKGTDGRWRIVYQHQSWPGCRSPYAPHPMTTASEEELEAAEDTVG
jgi:uncharacterized protein (TIGR02246 family)